MPAYRWTCPACGEANAADSAACLACACPSHATSAQIASHRAERLARGGALKGEAAVAAQPDLGAFDVLGRPLLAALTGWAGPR